MQHSRIKYLSEKIWYIGTGARVGSAARPLDKL